MKILIIDDSRFQRNQFKKNLEELGFEVNVAEDAEVGLDIISQDRPNMVFCDLLMPKMDGFGFLEQMQSRDLKIPVFIVSANIQTSVRERCISLGAIQFFNKPMTKDQIQMIVIPQLKELGLV